MSEQAKVTELESIPTGKDGESIQVCQLSLKGFTVEISSVGASITKLLFPNGDDIVLGYRSPLNMYQSGNPPFLGVVVGRVANRIAKGTFHLNDQDYQLECNNDPNHLHGGSQGFNTRLWDLRINILDNSSSVQCTLLSPDGDQGYPGSVTVTATYSLRATEQGVALRLDMTAKLQADCTVSSPINLAQHSYFNLAKHNHPNGILDHAVTLACAEYTPTDATLIPTRQVVAVKEDPAMDLTTKSLMRTVLTKFAVSKADLTEAQANEHMARSMVAKSGPNCPTPNQPYGIDHNYVVPQTNSNGLNLVGTIEHTATRRRLTVSTTAPGVQVYTGNYLDGDGNKDGATYGQWQGMCLETQNFPDSILTHNKEEEDYPEFAKGKCCILTPGGPDYQHTVEYSLEQG